MTVSAVVVAAAVVGACVGSFCTVVVWRRPRGAALTGRSMCWACGAVIGPLCNVPVVSWLTLRGRARCCGNRISAAYPLIELSVAASWAAAAAVLRPVWLLVVVLPAAAGAVCWIAVRVLGDGAQRRQPSRRAAAAAPGRVP